MGLKKSRLSGNSMAPSKTNKLNEFFDGIKSKKTQRKLAAKRNISNNNAANEKKILDVLSEIDFGNSNLDPKVLEHKTISTQNVGDLEQTRNEVMEKIISNTKNSGLKLKEFDSKLYEIALEYKNAISNGHKNAAFAARSALHIGVVQIRNQLADIRSDWRQNYLNDCTVYMDKWIQLIENCISLDASMDSYEKSMKQLETKLADLERRKSEYNDRIKNDDNLQRRLNMVRDKPVGETLTDPALKRLFDDLVDVKIQDTIIKFDLTMNKMQKHKQVKYAQQVEMLRRSVENMPIPNDPYGFQKFKDTVNSMFREATKVENEYAEFLQLIFDVDGRVNQMAHSQAAKMENQMMQDQIIKFVEGANSMSESDYDKMSTKELRERLGLKVEEEQKEESRNEDAETEDETEENLN